MPPALAARCMELVSACTWGVLTMFWANRITEPTCPALTLASRLLLAAVPCSPTMIRWPSSLAAERGTDGRGCGAGAGAAAPVDGARTCATHAVGNAAAVPGIPSTTAATATIRLLRTPPIIGPRGSGPYACSTTSNPFPWSAAGTPTV